MSLRKAVASLALAVLLLPAGSTDAPGDGNAQTAPFDIRNIANSQRSAPLDVVLSGVVALLNAGKASAVAGAAGDVTLLWPRNSGTTASHRAESFEKDLGLTFAAAGPLSPAVGARRGEANGELLTLALLFNQAETVSAESLLGFTIDAQSNLQGAQVLSCGAGEACPQATASIPGAIWLFASALLGLLAVGHPRKRTGEL